MGPTNGATEDYLKGLTVALQHGAHGDTAQHAIPAGLQMPACTGGFLAWLQPCEAGTPFPL